MTALFTKKVFVVCLILIFIFTFVLPSKANAQVPFGGFVTSSIPCPCSDGFLLFILGASGLQQLVFQIGTPQYMNYQLPRAGVWALGLYSPGAVCLIPVPHGCNPIGSPTGTIMPIVGTSM